MKKLNLLENFGMVNGIKNLWSYTNNYNLIYYYIDDTYLYIYSRVTKRGSLYLFDSAEERDKVKIRINDIKNNMEASKVNINNFSAVKKQTKAKRKCCTTAFSNHKWTVAPR